MHERALWQLTGDELVAQLRDSQTTLNGVYDTQLALLGELTSRNLTSVLGYGSPAQLLQDLLRISRGEANRRLAHAAAVTTVQPLTGPALPPPLPATAAAIHTGAIGAEHVETIRRVMAALPEGVSADDREQAERTLVEAACVFDPAAVAKLGRAIHARLDQDGRPPTEADVRSPANELRLDRRADGGVKLTGRLGAEGAALLTAVLDPLAKPRAAVEGEPDPRSRVERQGDALVDVLRLAANAGDLPAEGGERPTLIVMMALEALQEGTAPALMADALIDASLARRLACDSAVVPAVLGARSEPLDIGRRTRTVPTALRRALVLRDRACTFPGCTIPARWCDAHHVRHWANGGATALRNLALLCGRHHDLVHRSAWEITMRDGLPEFIPPTYIDPTRQPRRNHIHLGIPTQTRGLPDGVRIPAATSLGSREPYP